MQPVVFNGVTFYPAAWEGKTEEEFVNHESHHGLNEKQLKEAYGILTGAKKKKVEPEKK